jgi:pyruvate dehydrogenase E2 component (dihydrolipoamide acetyltransferase)
MYKFKFVDIGEGLHEGVVGEIHVKKGDKIKEGDSLFIVETDKVNSEMPSPVDGIIDEVFIKTGETVHVGDVTFNIDDGSSNNEEESMPLKVTDPVDDSNASVVGEVKVSNDIKTFGNTTKPTAKIETIKLTTPVARRIAKDKGIDINKVTGSGPNGRVLIKDVEGVKTVDSPVAKATSQIQDATCPKKTIKQAVSLDGRREKITPIRKAIAKAMLNS